MIPKSRLATMNRTATGPRSQRLRTPESNGLLNAHCGGDVLRTGTVRGPVGEANAPMIPRAPPNAVT